MRTLAVVAVTLLGVGLVLGSAMQRYGIVVSAAMIVGIVSGFLAGRER